MSVVCDACGSSNRATAMFCIGCAGRLPGFVPSGPSALEAMKAAPRFRHRPVQSVPAPVLPAETRAFWLRLGGLGAAMVIGFTGWYLYVTDKEAAPLLAGAPTAAAVPAPPQLVPQLAAPSMSIPPPMQEAKSARVTRPPAPLPTMPEAPAQAVAKFYRALSMGDGQAAAAIVIPAKRGVGPFDAANMSKFYRSFKEPLRVRSIRQIDANVVEARYSYRASATPCEATAIVETEVVLHQTLIRRIRANC
jgi:hypothetical protein